MEPGHQLGVGVWPGPDLRVDGEYPTDLEVGPTVRVGDRWHPVGGGQPLIGLVPQDQAGDRTGPAIGVRAELGQDHGPGPADQAEALLVLGVEESVAERAGGDGDPASLDRAPGPGDGEPVAARSTLDRAGGLGDDRCSGPAGQEVLGRDQGPRVDVAGGGGLVGHRGTFWHGNAGGFGHPVGVDRFDRGAVGSAGVQPGR